MFVNGLRSSLCFGAAAAIALVFALYVGTPSLGSTNVLVCYWVASVTVYLALLGTTPRRVIRNAAAAALGAAIVVVVSSGPAAVAVGLTIVLAVVRSGLEFSMKSARAVLVEIVLGLVGLAFASWIASPGWLGDAASLWAFALVQSLYFLIPGRRRSKSGHGLIDPFDGARNRILELLEGV